jgi:hypothetical protein
VGDERAPGRFHVVSLFKQLVGELGISGKEEKGIWGILELESKVRAA